MKLCLSYFIVSDELLLGSTIEFVRYSQFLATLSTTASQYATTVCSCHSFTETVFVFSLSVRGLECSFHCYILILCYYSP